MFALICVVILLSIFSSAVMLYIALATSIGPWIGPLLVLMVPSLLRIFFVSLTTFNEIAAVIGGSIGGILATACAFSFPAFYFVDSALYNEWLLAPFFFIGTVAMLCFLAGAFGMICADQFENRLNIISQDPFPSAQLIFSMIHATDHLTQRIKLLCGGMLYGGFLFFQKLFLLLSHATRLYSIINNATIMPMLVSIGFVTGHVIAIPLFVGLLIRFVFVDIGCFYWYSSCSPLHFSLAFCTGIIINGLLISFFKSAQSFFAKNIKQTVFDSLDIIKSIKFTSSQCYWIMFGIVFFLYGSHYCDISIFFAVYSMSAAAIAIYFMVVLAAKTGLAYLGRFATFVMVPAMIIFRCSPLQLIILATCVEVAGGVAVDVLSGRKIVALAGLRDDRFIIIQWIGLLVASVATGFVLWALCSYLQLGSCELAGYKAHARALLLGVDRFDIAPLLLGFFVGTACSLFRINTGTLLGGILMPLETATGLIAGGAIAFFVKNKDSWYPLASGVFAANSLYMIIKAVFLSR
jgi:hypothetical protein